MKSIITYGMQTYTIDILLYLSNRISCQLDMSDGLHIQLHNYGFEYLGKFGDHVVP
jgi:hypothetical protein